MRRLWLSSLALSLLLGAAGAALGNEKNVTFGSLERVGADAARSRVTAWLKESGKADPARLDAIWKQNDRAVIDRLADSICLASPEAAALLRSARDPLAPAPTKMPTLLGKDSKLPAFVRANLALAYARALTNRRVYEEALVVLKGISPEQTADPAAHLFYRAVAEHALLQRPEATRTISQLLEDAVGIAPERYKTVSTLMLLDMHTWKDKDLGAVARKMENIERRLELARGGPQTQKLQKEVILRLDELIKELENKAKKKSGGS